MNLDAFHFGRGKPMVAKPAVKPAPQLANQVQEWNEPVKPAEGPILLALRHERIDLLVQSNALNRKLSAVERNISLMERNTDLEQQIPEIANFAAVRAIWDSLRKHEEIFDSASHKA